MTIIKPDWNVGEDPFTSLGSVLYWGSSIPVVGKVTSVLLGRAITSEISRIESIYHANRIREGTRLEESGKIFYSPNADFITATGKMRILNIDKSTVELVSTVIGASILVAGLVTTIAFLALHVPLLTTGMPLLIGFGICVIHIMGRKEHLRDRINAFSQQQRDLFDLFLKYKNVGKEIFFFGAIRLQLGRDRAVLEEEHTRLQAEHRRLFLIQDDALLTENNALLAENVKRREEIAQTLKVQKSNLSRKARLTINIEDPSTPPLRTHPMAFSPRNARYQIYQILSSNVLIDRSLPIFPGGESFPGNIGTIRNIFNAALSS
jgi:hypothetical protein